MFSPLCGSRLERKVNILFHFLLGKWLILRALDTDKIYHIGKIDRLVFNANFSNISAISWRHSYFIDTINLIEYGHQKIFRSLLVLFLVSSVTHKFQPIKIWLPLWYLWSILITDSVRNKQTPAILIYDIFFIDKSHRSSRKTTDIWSATNVGRCLVRTLLAVASSERWKFFLGPRQNVENSFLVLRSSSDRWKFFLCPTVTVLVPVGQMTCASTRFTRSNSTNKQKKPWEHNLNEITRIYMQLIRTIFNPFFIFIIAAARYWKGGIKWETSAHLIINRFDNIGTIEIFFNNQTKVNKPGRIQNSTLFTLWASKPVNRFFLSWSRIIINGRPYSSKAREPWADITMLN